MTLAWLKVRMKGKLLHAKVVGGGRKSHPVYQIAVEAEAEVEVGKDMVDRGRPAHPRPDPWALQAAEAATPVTAAIEAAVVDLTRQPRRIPRPCPGTVVVEEIYVAGDIGVTRDKDLTMVRRDGDADTTVLVARACRIAGAETAAILDVGAGRSRVRHILRVLVLVHIVAVVTNFGVKEGLRKPDVVRSPYPDLVLAVGIGPGTATQLGKRNIRMISKTAHNPALGPVL
mmetsp:Transcript_30523/g.64306  ORF Transcript_30523/g.64306 Transcript_30523/m.64306 type:complete len:229 (-) Transcript_30523:1175-1861(-)